MPDNGGTKTNDKRQKVNAIKSKQKVVSGARGRNGWNTESLTAHSLAHITALRITVLSNTSFSTFIGTPEIPYQVYDL